MTFYILSENQSPDKALRNEAWPRSERSEKISHQKLSDKTPPGTRPGLVPKLQGGFTKYDNRDI